MLWSTCSYRSCAEVAPDAVGDPLLRPVDHPVVPLSSRRSLYVRNITPRIWLRDTKTEPQLSSGYTRQPSLALLFRSESGNRGASNSIPASETPHHATPAHAAH